MWELAKGGVFKVEFAGTSIDQKLNHAWNCPIIKVTYSTSIFQLNTRVETQNYSHKKLFKNSRKMIFGTTGHV